MSNKWRVSGTVVGGKYLGHFEAETGAEAVKKAAESADVSFCHQCSGECEDPQIVRFSAEREKANGEWETFEEEDETAVDLKTALEKAEQERDEARARMDELDAIVVKEQTTLAAMTARADQMQHERDLARTACQGALARAEKAEAEVAAEREWRAERGLSR